MGYKPIKQLAHFRNENVQPHNFILRSFKYEFYQAIFNIMCDIYSILADYLCR